MAREVIRAARQLEDLRELLGKALRIGHVAQLVDAKRRGLIALDGGKHVAEDVR